MSRAPPTRSGATAASPTDTPSTLPDPDLIVVPGSGNPLQRVHGRELAEAVQLIIEYDPEPPSDAGSLPKASPKTRRLARRIMLGDQPLRAATRFGREMMRARLRRARATT